MPIYTTRKFRNAAAALMLMTSVTHIGQLWFRETTPINLMIALVGVYYLPHTSTGRRNYPTVEYPPPEATADPEWLRSAAGEVVEPQTRLWRCFAFTFYTEPAMPRWTDV